MADISYFDAWRMWLDGKSTLGSSMFGLPMIWWGRTGKITAFISAMIIVVDIAGPERLRRSAQRLRDNSDVLFAGILVSLLLIGGIAVTGVVNRYPLWFIDRQTSGLLVVILVRLLRIISYIVFMIGMILVLGYAWWFVHDKVVSGLLTTLEHPRAVHLRIAATLMLVVGFHFDLLAS